MFLGDNDIKNIFDDSLNYWESEIDKKNVIVEITFD
jgi:hypothetical protein